MIQLPVNIFNFTILTSVVIGLTFGLLLIFTKRFNQRANRFLGFVPVIIALWNCWVLVIDFDLYRFFSHVNWIPLNYSLALGPCLYFYCIHLSDNSFRFRKIHLLHFLPACLEITASLIQGFESSQKGIKNYETDSFYSLSPVLQLAAIISISIYCFAISMLIKKYHNWLEDNYTNENQYNLRWLYRLIGIFAILWVLWIPYTLIDYFVFDYELGIRAYYPLYILMSIVTIWISAEAFLKPEVILQNRSKPLPKETIPSEEIAKQAIWLKEKIEANLFYLNSELTLSLLADELKVHPHNVSRIINEGLHKSFTNLINEYRIEAVIKKLNNPQYDHITLLGKALDSGFNSKSTFNRVFKKVTGKTPAEYKDQTVGFNFQ